MKHAWLMLLPWNVIFFTPWAEAQQLGQEQQGTIAEIKKLGGKVETERDGSGKSFLTVNLEDRKIPDEFLKRFRGWSNLRKLNLSGTQINGSGLQYRVSL